MRTGVLKLIKKLIPIIVGLAILSLIYFVGFDPGKTSGCNTVPIESEVYTQEDYEQACAVAFRYFKGFRGCTMTEIRYAGDDELDAMKEWAKEYSMDEVIILESDFTTDSKGGDGSFNPNDTYNDWNWILARDKNGKWKHKDHGYG